MKMALHQRNISLDIVRIVAIFAVIMLHSSADFVAFYPKSSNEFIIGNIFNAVSRIGVPLFLMISGALFLDERREMTLKIAFSKYVKNLAVITIIWAIFYSAIYHIVFPLLSKQVIDIKEFFGGILFGHRHMWYLFMIIGLYIITPFLKKFVNKENKCLVLSYIAVSFCINFFEPIIKAINDLGFHISFVNNWIDRFRLDFFSGYVTYFLVGWYIVHIGINQKWIRHLIYSLGAASLVFIVLFVHFTGEYDNVYENIGVPVFLYSVSAFLAINNIQVQLSEKNAKILATLSKLAFGAYIIHMLILTIFFNVFPYSNHCVLYIIISFVVASCISFLISYIISKIPVLKKIIKT